MNNGTPSREISILVVGAGVMGRGIAKLFGGAGLRTSLVSRSRPADFQAEGVTVLDAWPEEPVDLVLESVYEDAEAKRAVFAESERRYGSHPVLASNTSGLPLDELAEGLRYPERFLAMHFFMPADIFPMIEVVRAGKTGDAAFELAADVVRAADREPILVGRPIVGYVINRLQHTILHEAYYLVSEGIASAQTIDRVAKLLLGPRFTVTGLLEQKDIGGLRMHAGAQRSIVPQLAHTGTPNPMLLEMVERGDVGITSGRGFYEWGDRDPKAVRANAEARLLKLLAFLRDELGESPPEVQPVATAVGLPA